MSEQKRLSKKISICNLKGGVGKTMLSTQLAHFLGAHGKKVLLVDTDYQGNSSSILIPEGASTEGFTKSAALYRESLEIFSPMKVSPNIDVVRSDVADEDLIECSFLPMLSAENVGTNLEAYEAAYDYIIFDCPPSLGTACAGPLLASDWILIPLELGASYKYSVIGINKALKVITRLRPNLRIAGYLINRLPLRSASDEKLVQALRTMMGPKLFSTVLHDRRPLQRCGLLHIPYWQNRSGSRQAEMEMTAAFDELLERVGEEPLGNPASVNRAFKLWEL